jgi:hypothetical protein
MSEAETSGLHRVTGEFNMFGKTRVEADEFHRIVPELKRLARHFAVEMSYLNALAVITDVFRNDPKSVHSVGRGIDFRISCSMRDAERVREWFNRVFPYGKGTIQTIPPLDHGTAPHFHLQVRAR